MKIVREGGILGVILGFEISAVATVKTFSLLITSAASDSDVSPWHQVFLIRLWNLQTTSTKLWCIGLITNHCSSLKLADQSEL